MLMKTDNSAAGTNQGPQSTNPMMDKLPAASVIAGENGQGMSRLVETLEPTNQLNAEETTPGLTTFGVKIQRRQPDIYCGMLRRIIKILRPTTLRGADVCVMDLSYDDAKGYVFSCTYRGKGVFKRDPPTVTILVPEKFVRSWLVRHCPDDYLEEFGPEFDPTEYIEIADNWPDNNVDIDIDKITREAIDTEIRQEFGVDLEEINDPEAVEKVKRIILREFALGPLSRCRWDFLPILFLRALLKKWYGRLEIPERFICNEYDLCYAEGIVTTNRECGDLDVDWGHVEYFVEVNRLVHMKGREPLIDEYDLLPEWLILRYGFTEDLSEDLTEWYYIGGLFRCSTWRKEQTHVDEAKSIASVHYRWLYDKVRITTLYHSNDGGYILDCSREYVHSYPTLDGIRVPVTEDYARYWLYCHKPSEYIKEFGAVYNLPDDYVMLDPWADEYTPWTDEYISLQ